MCAARAGANFEVVSGIFGGPSPQNLIAAAKAGEEEEKE
jgi:hypothetical protein